MAVALIALFVALTGSAWAVGTAVVPLAKRALTADKAKVADRAKVATTAKSADKAKIADDAKMLGGKTGAALVSEAVTQASAAPGPASSAASLVTIKSAPYSLPAGQNGDFTVTCDAGQKAIAGYDTPVGDALGFDSRPSADGGSWKVFVASSRLVASSGTVYAICLK